MNSDFIYLRSFVSISKLQFFPIGHMGIKRPTNGNINVDSYFDAKPINLAVNIEKFYITSQYTVFLPEFEFFGHFKVMTPFEIASPHKSFSKEQLKELIDIHNQDCKNHTDQLRIDFPNGQNITLPENCYLSSDDLANIFFEILLVKRWNRDE